MEIKKIADLTITQQQKLTQFINKMKQAAQQEYKLEELAVGESEQYTYFVAEAAGEIVGLGVLSQFDPSESEITLVTINDESIIEKLLTAVLAACQSPMIKSILVIVEAKDVQQEQVIRQTGFKYAFTELAMILDIEKSAAFTETKLPQEYEIVPATLADDLTILKFWQPEAETAENIFSEADILRTFLLKKDGQVLASMRVDHGKERLGIYGVVVKEEVRGQGLGRLFLAAMINRLKKYQLPLYLEVEKDNGSAKHLYQSLGFREIAQFNYFKKE
ncbi:GNAT family N-acetyltransferase [Enterococcus sp. HY326]|uniref:GNAT family N-acetyltransferase n=1 Tax=Enterococcus sp. HY326 TaxID=2971265 RepID=UPI002240977F|nr:GNAT family N-acetyltransferase [Enterococcus sp. HY326]